MKEHVTTDWSEEDWQKYQGRGGRKERHEVAPPLWKTPPGHHTQRLHIARGWEEFLVRSGRESSTSNPEGTQEKSQKVQPERVLHNNTGTHVHAKH